MFNARWIKPCLVLAVASAVTLGVASAAGAIPRPLCGPTYLWICVTPGCPSCPSVVFAGTLCDKRTYERQTGRACSPYPGD